MPLFQKKKKKKVIHRADQTLEAALEKTLIRNAKRDPDWALRMALKKFELEDAPEDPGQKEAQVLAAEITKMTLQEIKNDPELRARFVQKRTAELIGSLPDEDGEGEFEPDDPVDVLIHRREQLQELGLLGNQGALGGLINADVIKAALDLVKTRIGGQPEQPQIPQSIQPQERMVVIEVDGKLTQVTETQYNQLLNQGKLRPVAALGPAREQGQPAASPAVEPEPTEQQQNYLELPEMLDSIDFNEIGGYLEMRPQDFANLLVEQSTAGVLQATLLLGYLKKTNLQTIIETIAPYRGNPRVSSYIEKILTPEGQQWASEVLRLVLESEVSDAQTY